jgi:hypothetical protein
MSAHRRKTSDTQTVNLTFPPAVFPAPGYNPVTQRAYNLGNSSEETPWTGTTTLSLARWPTSHHVRNLDTDPPNFPHATLTLTLVLSSMTSCSSPWR